MKAHHRRNTYSITFVWLLGILALVLAIIPSGSMAVSAQEGTEEPAPATETATATPVIPTATPLPPTATPTPEEAPPTATPIPPTTLPEATEEPDTLPPTAPPETTQEPTTPPATEPPPESTAEPTSPAESTAEPTIEPETTTEPTVEPETTTEPVPTTPAPSETPVVTLFSDDFQDGNSDGWLATDGWAVVEESGNYYLTTDQPSQRAALSLDWPHFTMTAQVRVANGAAAHLDARASNAAFAVVLDAQGNVSLVRGETVLANSPAPSTSPEVTPDPTAAPEWHTVSVQALGNVITVSVDGAPRINYTDTETATSGSFSFTTDAVNSGAVDIDNIIIQKLDEPQVITTPEPTVEPTAEPTEQSDIQPETTVEPETTAEAPVAEMPAEDTATGVQVGINFDDENADWALGAGGNVVDSGESNFALLMAANSTLGLNEPLSLSNFTLTARLNILTDAANGEDSGLGIFFRLNDGSGYLLTIESDNSALYALGETNELLAESGIAHALNSWHAITFTVNGGNAMLNVNGVDELIVEGLNDSAGDISFVANSASNIMLDDIAITELASTPATEPEATPEPSAAAIPMGLTPETEVKLDGSLTAIVTEFLQSDPATAFEIAESYGLDIDETGRVRVVIYPANGYTTEAVAAIAEAAGGVVLDTNERRIVARIPIPGFVPLVNTAEVGAVRLPARAASTSGLEAPAGSAATEAFDMLNVYEWHLGGFTGTGVDIAIIDRGFGNPVTLTAEQSCVNSATLVYGTPQSGDTTHGLTVAEVVCDIAPNANVRLFKADDNDGDIIDATVEMANAVNAARTTGYDVIIIAMDLGVVASPGDGTLGYVPSGGNKNLYDEIAQARQAGIAVVVAAGNNGNNDTDGLRYRTINYTSGTVTFNIDALQGDVVNLSWNDWGGSNDYTVSLSGPGMTTVNKPARIGNPVGQLTVGSCTVQGDGFCDLTLSISGSNAGVIQVQLLGSGKINAPSGGTFTELTTAGTLGRPADSREAITVGAVCASPDDNYPVYEYSSRGPVFGAGGSAPTDTPPYSQNEVKPEIVGPTYVSTVSTGSPTSNCVGGFNGTSAAAAHIGGIIALMKQNNSNMPQFSTGGSAAVDAIEDYLMGHSFDMPFGSSADGFDMVYGAGFAVLGSPTYDLSQISHPAVPDNAPAACTGFIYVSQDLGTLGNSVPNGSEATPYTSIGQAVNNASAGDCIIVGPGEWATPLYFNGAPAVNVYSYDSVTSADNADSIMPVMNTYLDSDVAGVYIKNGTTAFGFHGFTFRIPQRLDFFVPTARPILVDASDDASLMYHNFSSMNDVIYPMISVINSSDGVIISYNTFNGLTGSTLNSPTIQVTNSGVSANPVEIRNNTFSNNTHTNSSRPIISGSLFFKGLLALENSAVDVVNNAFVGNNIDSLIRISTGSAADTTPVRVVGNVILNNTTAIDAGTPGPLFSLYFVRAFHFVNNTLAHNNLSASGVEFGAVILRGDADDSTTGNSNNYGSINNAPWEFHNNLLTDNQIPGGLVLVRDVPDNLCQNLNGTNNQGATNNWIWDWDGLFTTGEGGVCHTTIADGSNNGLNGNIVNVDPEPGTDPNDNRFVGPLLSLNALTDPLYYQLRRLSPTFLNEGVETGNTAVYDALISAGLDYSRDYADNVRKQDSDLDTNLDIDIGAFEFVPLRIKSGEDNVVLPDIIEDNVPYVSHELGQHVEGGFGSLTFSLAVSPDNYGVDCPLPPGTPTGVNYSNSNGVIIIGSTAYYCPPAHFFTDTGASNVGWADTTGVPPDVTFDYQAIDSIGALAQGTLTIVIRPSTTDDDTTLSSPVWDGVSSNEFSAAGIMNTTIQFNLRPFFTTDNFFLSDSSATDKRQFPFTYSQLDWADNELGAGNAGDDPATLFTNLGSAVNTATGEVSLTPVADAAGMTVLHYTVTDSNPANGNAGATIDMYVRVRIVSDIPDEGLHDDSSFAFSYSGTGWKPIYSDTGINNTLHETRINGDQATFRFIGAGFTLYMEGLPSGAGEWQLDIRDSGGGSNIPNWTVGANGESTATLTIDALPVTCSTYAATNGNVLINSRVTNGATQSSTGERTVLGYTVTCNGLNDVTVHTVVITNNPNGTAGANGPKLQVDAFSIIPSASANADPLAPGFYDVSSGELIDMFTAAGNWTELTDAKATGGLARTTTDANADLTFQITGATGFAIGTILEDIGLDGTGATYNVCVTGTGVDICQRYDNALGAAKATTYKVFRPFNGLQAFDSNGDPITYTVTIDVLSVPTGERMFIDSITVFNDPLQPMGFGETDVAELDKFIFNNGLDDSWALNFAGRAPYDTVAALNRGVIAAGPAVTFEIPNAADTFYVYHQSNFRLDSQNLMVCVDRAVDSSTQAGNCVVVNMRQNPETISGTYQYQQVQADGTFSPVNDTIMQPVYGSMVFTESMFRSAWASSGNHVVEIFSLTNEKFSVDRVAVQDTSAALPTGLFEEFSEDIYFFGTTGFGTPSPTYTIGGDAFSQVESRFATRASGKGMMETQTVGDGIIFGFQGTAAEILFEFNNKADAVLICVYSGDLLSDGAQASDVNTVLNSGACHIENNESARLVSQGRRFVGPFEYGNFTVVVQMLDDDYAPKAHTGAKAPVTMRFDGVRVYDTPWLNTSNWNDTSNLNILSTGMAYDFNYTNRDADKNFLYFGNWSTANQRGALNGKVDTPGRGGAPGATVAFRTDGGDAIIINRNTRRAYTPFLICAAPVSGGPLSVDLSQQRCQVINNDGGTATAQPVSFKFNESGNTGPHIVSITLLTTGSAGLDSVEVVDSSSPLTEGQHDSTNPAIIYQTGSNDLVRNGKMEVDGHWSEIGGLPATSNVYSGLRYEGARGRQVVATAAGQGIQSEDFQLQNGKMYTVIARVNIASGAVGTVQMSVSGTTVYDATADNTITGKWQTLVVRAASDISGTAQIQFTASGGVVTFTVDDVHIIESGTWQQRVNTRSYYGGSVMTSYSYGAEVRFEFTGTAAEIGMITENIGGEVEICYTDSVDYGANGLQNANCATYDNESARPSYTTSRFVGPLPSNTYTIVIRDVENGYSSLVRNNTVAARNNRRSIGQIAIDYVRVYNSALPPAISAPGTYEDTAVDGSGNRYLQGLPAELWGTVEGRFARNYSESSFFSLRDSRGAAIRTYAGPTAVMQVNVPSTDGVILVLHTGPASRTNTKTVQVCVDDTSGAMSYNGTGYDYNDAADNCADFLTDLGTQSQVVVSKSDIPALGVVGNHVVTVRALTPGVLPIDRVQVIHGTALAAGYFEESVGNGLTTDGNNDIFELSNTGTWDTVSSRTYSGGQALVNTTAGASVQFSLQNATGFTFVTEFGKTGGNLQVQITQTSGTDCCFSTTQTVSTNNTRTVSGTSGITFSGLPEGNYDVTITNQTSAKLVVDAVQVYGALSVLGSLYDDQQRDANNALILTYGPDNNSWSFTSGTRARGYLNQTYALTDDYGASISFVAGDGTKEIAGIVLHYGTASTSDTVEVCWTQIDNANVVQERTCATHNLADKAGKQQIAVPAGSIANNPTDHYAISITNLKHGGRIYFDAVQILEAGVLAEGIYQQDDASLTFNNATQVSMTQASNKLVQQISPSGYVEFDMEGIGFSVVLVESSTTSGSYTVCVSAQGNNDCADINETVNNSASSTALQQVGLTYMGLHGDAAGNNGSYTVRITNTDGSKVLNVDRVEVLGADSTLRINAVEPVDNTDPRLQYFPFGSLTEVVERRPLSFNGSQHQGNMRGSVAYFEFTGEPDFEYIRQVNKQFGQARVCFGVIGTDTTKDAIDNSQCVTVNNQTGVAADYNQSAAIDTGAVDCVANACWVTIENTDGRKLLVDVVRLVDSNDPLPEGIYQNNHANIMAFDGNLSATTNTEIAYRGAYGGTVFNTKDINGGVLFQLQGSGFAAHLRADRNADLIRVCVDDTATTDASTVISNGICQVFNTESRANYDFAATILGLNPATTYTAVVQLLNEDYITAPHAAGALKMDFDYVEVFGSDLNATTLNQLTPGQRYEGNYNNRNVDNNFMYVGDNWSTLSGRAASRHSGQNIDQIRRTTSSGSSVIFRTNNADAVTIYRASSRNYAPLLVCAISEADRTDRTCSIIENNGVGNQAGFTLHYNTGAGTGPHIVTVTALTNGAVMFDAVEPAVAGVLSAGLHDEFTPGIQYNAAYNNVLPNGGMEGDELWNSLGATVNSRWTNPKYIGRYSRKVDVSTALQGIESASFTLEAGKTYTVTGWVYISSGTQVTAQLANSGSPIGGASATSTNGIVNKWQQLRFEYTPSSTISNATLQIVATNGATLFYVDGFAVAEGGSWAQVFHTRNYYGGSIMQSSTPGASVTFAFQGTGAMVGMPIDRNGGDTEICVDDDATFDETSETGNAQTCIIYQNEEARPTPTVTRLVAAGLPNGTYYVRIRDVEDGVSVLGRNQDDPRLNRYAVGRLSIDFVQVFDDAAPPDSAPGFYNEDAVDGSGTSFLQVLPENRWSQITGRAAKKDSGQSRYAVVDDNNRARNTYAGPTAVISVNVPSGVSSYTVVVDTSSTSRQNSQWLLVCADNLSGTVAWDRATRTFSIANATNCTLTDAMQTSGQVMVDLASLLGGSLSGQHKIILTTLSKGFFNIDGYQVISNNVLSEGLYNEFLPDTVLNFNASGGTALNPDTGRNCDLNTEWCSRKDNRANGALAAETKEIGATLDFTINGTGWSILTRVDGAGADFMVCYRKVGGDPFPASYSDFQTTPGYFSGQNYIGSIASGDVWCDVVSANNNARNSNWTDLNPGRLLPRGTLQQYGFAFYGLPADTYDVQIRNLGDTVGGASGRTLWIDAIVVFGDASDTTLTGGFYDDTTAGLDFAPFELWTTTTSRQAPPRGPYNLIQHTTSNAGAVMQAYVSGNAITVYQQMDARGSSNINACLVLVEGVYMHCGGEQYTTDNKPATPTLTSDFSQRGRRTYFTPIVFYGFGEGNHLVIFENQEPGRNFTIDAINVWP